MSTLQVVRSKCWQFTSSTQCSGTATLTLSDKVPVCIELRTSTALPFPIPPSSSPRSLGTVLFQGFYKLYLEITSFLQKRAHLFLWGTTTEAWAARQWCQPLEGDDNCSHRPHSAKATLLSCRSAPTAQDHSSEDASSSRQLQKSQACETVWFCLFCLVSCLTWVTCQ